MEYRKYWMNEKFGKVFCLVHAPDAESACSVHREAHGHVAERIIEVDPDVVDGFLGGGEINAAGAALFPEFENPVRVHAVDWTNESGQT